MIEEQVKAVSDVLRSSPLSPVLPFFAGLTGLSNPAVRDVLLEVSKHQLDVFAILANRPQTEAADRRRLALALLTCIYESQCSGLCQQVVCPAIVGPLCKVTISFNFLRLKLTDCLSIGYFLANHTSCNLSLGHCSIDGAGVEAIVRQLKQSAETCTLSSYRRLDLSDNPITSGYCMKVIGDVLQTQLLTYIAFRHCWLPTQVGRNLTYLLESLSRRSTSIDLHFTEVITSAHTHYLVLLVTICPLRVLTLVTTNVGEGFFLLAEAVKQTAKLETLILIGCIIGDRELIHLGRKARTSVRRLDVPYNPFTSSAVKRFLQHHYFSRLQELDIGRPLNDKEEVVYNQLQLYRRQCNLPPLTVSIDLNVRAESAALAVEQDRRSLPKEV